MIQLQPELEAQLAAEARASGLSLDRYVEKIVRARPAEGTASAPLPQDQAARMADLEKFFEEMASNSDQIPLLPDDVFTRESFYRDRD